MISFSKKEQAGDVWMDACVVCMQLAIVSFFLLFLFYDYKFTCCCVLQTWKRILEGYMDFSLLGDVKEKKER